MNMQEILRESSGEKVRVWCARFIYIGNVLAVGEDALLLSNTLVVFSLGEILAAQPERAEKSPAPSCMIPFGAIEFIEFVDVS